MLIEHFGHILSPLKSLNLQSFYTTGGGHSVLREWEGSFSTAHLLSTISTEATIVCWLCCECHVEMCPGRPGWEASAHCTPAGPTWGAGLKQWKEMKGLESSLQTSKTTNNIVCSWIVYMWNWIKITVYSGYEDFPCLIRNPHCQLQEIKGILYLEQSISCLIFVLGLLKITAQCSSMLAIFVALRDMI